MLAAYCLAQQLVRRREGDKIVHQAFVSIVAAQALLQVQSSADQHYSAILQAARFCSEYAAETQGRRVVDVDLVYDGLRYK